ncbi:MAG: HK97 family phage prohead protease [Hyphomicrobiales bacterium]|nr:HK97 family phage prohead protease [Hyphomicrobiales bacterium]
MTAQPRRDVINGALPLQSRKAEIPAASVNAETREFDIVISTGAKVRRYRFEGWDTRIAYDEELVISDKACNTERVRSGAVMMLDSHSTWGGVTQTFGKLTRAWVEGGKLMGRVKLHDAGVSEEADKLFGMIRGGTAPSISAGYTIDQAEITSPEKRGEVEQMLVTGWTLYEVSFVAMPADPEAKIARSQARTFPATITRKEATMAEETLEFENAEEDALTLRPVWPAAAVRKIRKSCDLLGLEENFAEMAMQRSSTTMEAIDWLQQKAVDAQPKRTVPKLAIMMDENSLHNPRAVAEAMGEAQSCRVTGAKPSDAARQFMGMTTMAKARHLYELQTGRRSTMMSDREVLDLHIRHQTTSDWEFMTATTMERTVKTVLLQSTSGVLSLSQKDNHDNFKGKKYIDYDRDFGLDTVMEHAEYKYGAFTDKGESFKVQTFGKISRWTRQAMINDDLGVFEGSGKLLALASLTKQADVMVDLLKANTYAGPTMADGVALFHADHANLAAGAALAQGTLGDLAVKLRRQTYIGKSAYPVEPYALMVPPELEITAKKLVAEVAATKIEDVNVFTTLLVVVEPRLSATKYYLVGNPEKYPGLTHAFLAGNDGPEIFTRPGWEVDGYELKVRLDFGAGFIDHRSWAHNPGA